MTDFAEANPGSGGPKFAVDRITGIDYTAYKLFLGDIGVDDGPVSSANPMPVTGALTDTQLRATAVVVSGPLTDAQLRATAVPVSGPLTDAQLRATAVPVSGPLTDTELRATAVPVSSTDLATLAGTVKLEDAPFASGDPGVFMLAVRQDAMAALGADGDYTPLQVNATGRLKVSAEPAAQTSVIGNITGTAQTVQISTDRTSNLMIYCTGTFAGANCTFEGSLNGTNWFAVQAVRSNSNTIDLTTGVLAAAPAYAWEVSVNGMNFFRVRSTAFTSGTQVWQMQPAPYATEPIPAAQVSGTQPVSGTVTANVGTSGLVVYTDSVANLAISATFTGTSRDGGATPAYNLFIVNAFADVAGTVRVEKSTDNTNWRRATADVAVAANTGQELTVRVTARYHRVVYVNGAAAQTVFSLTSSYQRQ